jgi:hypothetical protein
LFYGGLLLPLRLWLLQLLRLLLLLLLALLRIDGLGNLGVPAMFGQLRGEFAATGHQTRQDAGLLGPILRLRATATSLLTKSFTMLKHRK